MRRGVIDEKIQIPKSKSQTNPKRGQTAKSYPPSFWDLDFGICLGFGIWDLEFGSVSWLCAEDFTLEGFRSAAGLQVVHRRVTASSLHQLAMSAAFDNAPALHVQN